MVNGWWVQPDCNLLSGESFIRQALYGKRYFADRFGIEVTVGYNVDSFGHADPPRLLGIDIGGTKTALVIGTTQGAVLGVSDGETVARWRQRYGASDRAMSTRSH